MTLHPQYIIDEYQNKQAVILPCAVWQALLEILEEIQDIEAYDQAKKQNDESLPFEQALEAINKGLV
jgi:hypothetical protein